MKFGYFFNWAVPLILLSLLPLASFCSPETPYKYFRVGAKADLVTAPHAGYALMGGGTDLDEAFKWLCERAQGGDFLVLRASGDNEYNLYVQKLCHLNSVATLILPNRESANDPFVAETIAHAEAIFIAGGDQANYIRFWTATPVLAAINAAIKRGVPIGGTSAGLAVMGDWAYSAEGDKPDDPNLDSKTALMEPMGPRVTLAHQFLEIPVLKGVITDTHFAKRDRMGRLLVFLARIHALHPENTIRGIGVEQGVAVLLGLDGRVNVIGRGSAYFVEESFGTDGRESVMGRGAIIQKVLPGQGFDLKTWSGDGLHYKVTLEGGKLISSQAGESVY